MQKHTKRRSGVAVGTTSLLNIFFILCLTGLVLLSISTVAFDNRLAQKSIDNICLISAGKVAIAEQVAELDTKLLTLKDVPQEDYMEQAIKQAELCGFASTDEPDVITANFMLTEKKTADIKIRILPKYSETRFVLIESALVIDDDWVIEEGTPLLVN